MLEVQQAAQSNMDELAEIRKMVHRTECTIGAHTNVVDSIKSNLNFMNEEAKIFDECLKDKNMNTQ